MSNLYCQECGHKNIYILNTPNFCAGCGFNFAKGSTPKKEPPKNKRREHEENLEEDDGDYSESDFVPELRGLEYEIEGAEKRIYKGSELLNISEEEIKKIKRGRSKSKIRRQSKRD